MALAVRPTPQVLDHEEAPSWPAQSLTLWCSEATSRRSSSPQERGSLLSASTGTLRGVRRVRPFLRPPPPNGLQPRRGRHLGGGSRRNGRGGRGRAPRLQSAGPPRWRELRKPCA